MPQIITYFFTNCGASGNTGPSQSQINSSYSGTTLAGKVTSSNGIQLWTVPEIGIYSIEVRGARGGTQSQQNGGYGAQLKGDFLLQAGTVLKILVGQAGEDGSIDDGCGGGGGSFVCYADNTPLIIAGGGGGAGADKDGLNASISTTSTNNGDNSRSGSSNGNGGLAYDGGGGGGLIGNGASNGSAATGGYSFVNGGVGGTGRWKGGFGGGGAGSTTTEGGGGGGGYSGGPGGSSVIDAGGGGASYNSGINQVNVSGVGTGHGYVKITYLYTVNAVDLYASIDINKDNLKGKAYVLNRSNLDSELYILNRSDIGSQIRVEFISQISSNLYITNDFCTPSNVEIRQSVDWYIPSHLGVRCCNTLEGQSFIWSVRDDDRQASLNVVPPVISEQNDLSCFLLVSETDCNTADGIVSIWVRREIDKPSTINVTEWKYAGNNIRSVINVNPKCNTVDGKVFIWGIGKRDFPSYLKVVTREESFLKSAIQVIRCNTMDGTTIIYGIGEDDLYSKILALYHEYDWFSGSIRTVSPYNYDIYSRKYGFDRPSKLNVIVVKESDLQSQLGIRVVNKMTGDVDILGADDSDIYSSIDIKIHHNVQCSVAVALSNKMTGIIEVVPPERLADELSVVKDAFVRSSVPKLNYGGEQLLFAGFSSAKYEVLRILLGFDITALHLLEEGLKVEKVVLKLQYTVGRKPAIPLNIVAIPDEWTEYGVTWNNQPQLGDLVASTYETAKDTITFDITDYVLNARDSGVTKLSFCLKAETEDEGSVQFYAKELGKNYAPVIEFTYYDEIIRSTGRSNMDSKIFIAFRDWKYLSGKIEVRGYWTNIDLSCSVHILQPGERESSVTVSRPDLLGSVTARQSSRSDLNSVIKTRETSFYDLDNCSLMISRPDLLTKLYVANSYEIPSKLMVRVWEQDDLYSWGVVSCPVRPGSIYVVPYLDWPGKLKVRVTEDCPLNSSIIANQRDCLYSICVLNRDDLHSNISVRNGVIEDTPGSITATYPHIFCKIKVNPYYDFKGRIKVRRSADSDLASVIVVSAPERPCKVKINPYLLVLSNITVRGTEASDLASQIVVNAGERPGHIYVKYHGDLSSQLLVRRAAISDLSSVFGISRPGLFGKVQPRIHANLESQIGARRSKFSEIGFKFRIPYHYDKPSYIRVIGASKLPGVITVNSPYLAGVIAVPYPIELDWAGQLIVRQKLHSDIPAWVDVIQLNEITSQIAVRQTSDSSISSKIAVRRAENADLPSRISTWKFGTTPSSITVRRSGKSDILGGGYILFSDDILCSVDVLNRSSMPGQIMVVYSAESEIPGQVIPKIREYSDIESSFTVWYGGKSELLSSVAVAPGNKMTAIVDIVEPVRNVIQLPPVKDAFVRSDIPTLNNGYEQVLPVGRYGDALFRSLLGFYLNIPANNIIEKVRLKLYYSQQPKKELRIHRLPDSWTEGGVTWDNQPSYGDIIHPAGSDQYVDDVEGSFVYYDVTDYVIDEHYNTGKRNIDFLLKGLDEVKNGLEIFFSREEVNYKPELEVVYYDPKVWSYGRASLNSKIDVKYSRGKDLPSKLKVYAVLQDTDLHSELTILTQGWRKGTITVSRPELQGSLGVRWESYAEIPSKAAVRQKNFSAIGCSLQINQVYLGSKLYILNRDNLKSEIAVRRSVDEDLLTFGYISTPQCQGSINVPYRSDFRWKIKVRSLTEKGIESFFVISRPNLNGSLIIKQANEIDLNSNVSVQREGADDLASRLGVQKVWNSFMYSKMRVNVKARPGQIIVPEHVDLNSSVDINNPFAVSCESGLGSSLTVIRGGLASRVDVTIFYDLSSTISWNALGTNDLAGSVSVSKGNLPSVLVVTIADDLTSRLLPNVWGGYGVGSVLTISRPDLRFTLHILERNDLESKIGVQVEGGAELESLVVINRPDLSSNLEVHKPFDEPSSIAVRVIADADQSSVLMVNKPDIPSSISVTDYTDLPSSITAWRGESEFLSANLIVLDRSDLKGSVDVWYRSEISGVVRVISGNLASTIGVWGYGSLDIPGSLSPRIKNISNLPSLFDIVKYWSFLSCQIGVRYCNTMDGKTSIIGVGDADLPSILHTVVYYDLRSRLGIRVWNRMTGEIDFIPVGDEYLPGNIQVHPAADLPGTVVATKHGQLDMLSSLAVRGFGSDDLPSELDVHYRGNTDLVSEMSVAIDNRMVAKVFIIPVADADLQSSIEVHHYSNLPSKIYVRRERWSDLKSSIIAKQVYDMRTKITVRRPSYRQITCKTTVRQLGYSNFKSKISVRRWGWHDEASRVAVRRRAESEITIKVTVRQSDKSDLTSKVAARQTTCFDRESTIAVRRTLENDLTSKITVRQRSERDLISSITIHEVNDLPSSIAVRQANGSEISSKIAVRLTAESDLPGKIAARQWDKSDLSGSIDTWQLRTLPSEIWVPYRSQIESVITVVADYAYAFIM